MDEQSRLIPYVRRKLLIITGKWLKRTFLFRRHLQPRHFRPRPIPRLSPRYFKPPDDLFWEEKLPPPESLPPQMQPWPVPPKNDPGKPRAWLGQYPLLALAIFWMALPHEVLHYIAARVLGIEAYVGPGCIWLYRVKLRWKNLVITLAPAFVGLVGLVGLIVGYFCFRVWMTRWHVSWLLAMATALSWIASCGLDLADAWRVIRWYRRQHNNG